MTCGGCGFSIPPGAQFCPGCGLRVSSSPDSAAVPLDSAETILSDPDSASSQSSISSRLQEGSAFGSRYRILHRLGQGGMGVVYQAWDEELGIAVALKLIRPEVLADPEAGRQMERRFKRELVLARQVTHRNVVRIHDLGELSGVKYFTMPFIEGQNLAMLISREGKLPVARTLRIARQVAAGLAAAHEHGIVHRDLKPENVMLDADDNAVIMDFGLARSNDGANLTMTGAIMGTLPYMSPEQARGEAVDQRADIYSFGLMAYDMLAGRRRSGRHRDAMSEMFSRMQHAPPALRTVEPHVPDALEAIIARCVEPNAAQRFATTRELIAALDTIDVEGFPLPTATPIPSTAALPRPASARPRWALIGAGLVAVLLAAAGAWWMFTRGGPSTADGPRETISVLITDFQNATGDPVFEGSLEQALGLGIEGASFITAFPRRDAERAIQQIKPGAPLNEEIGRLVSQREGLKRMLVGAIAPNGGGYTVSVRVIDPATGTTLAETSAQADSKDEVLEAIGDLSAKVRAALGDATSQSDMAEDIETFTTTSLQAARDYAEGQQLAMLNRDEDAIVAFQRAIEKDPRLGRAFSGWAASAFKLGRTAEAEAQYQKAFSLLDRMTEREKLRTLGTYHLNLGGNYDTAIESYRELVEKYPADGAAHNNLALAYFNQLKFTEALEQGKHVLDIYPLSPLYRYNYALYAMYAGDFATAATEGRAALKGNANLPKAHLAIAMADLAEGRIDEARAEYERMRGTGARGASLAIAGLADIELYQGRFDHAVTLLEDAIAIDEAAKNSAGAAAKAIALAEAHEGRGNMTAAIAGTEGARKLANDPSILVPSARLLIEAGRAPQAASIAEQLGASLAIRPRAYARIVQAMQMIESGRAREAVDVLQEAQKLADLWLIRFTRGIAYIEAGAFPEALADLSACEKRRGEATAVFLDDVPTYRYMVPLSYWLGRAHQGIGAHEAAGKHYAAYLTLRSPATDPLAKDAARRNK